MSRLDRSKPPTSLGMAVYGLCLMASGIWRVVSAEGGQTGLIFGIVMGGAALAAGALFGNDRPRVAHLLAWLTVGMVGGWSCYESFIRKGWAEAETRQLIIIAISLVVAAMLIADARRRLPARRTQIDHGD